MPIKCIEDLLRLGWVRNGQKGYFRPNKRVVTRRRQLSMSERSEFGDILFPGNSVPVPPALEIDISVPQPLTDTSVSHGTNIEIQGQSNCSVTECEMEVEELIKVR